ncbi:MAG: right-handed parallel beta-helix repeat-containing protein, partial [Methanomassiliicoccales archaeon]
TFIGCYPGAVSVAGFGSFLDMDSNDIHGHGAPTPYDGLPQWGVEVMDEAQAVITYNNISDIGAVTGGAGILAFNGADVDINNNIITGIKDPMETTIGIQLQGTGTIPGIGSGTLDLTQVAVDSNLLSGHETGLYLLLSRQDPMAMTSPPIITNNMIVDNTVIGMKLEAVDNVTVSYNTITGNGLHGIYASTLYNDNLIQDNNIYGNDPLGGAIGGGLINFTPSALVDAAYNYWGSPTGPGGEWLGLGDSISTGVLYDPWYTAPVVGGSSISATGSRSTVVVSGTNVFSSVPASLDLELVGSGTYTVSAMLFTGAPEPGLAKPMPRYYHFHMDTVVGLTAVTVFAKYDAVPAGMNGAALRLYHFNVDHWEQFTSTYVDLVNNTVVGMIPTSSISPSLAMLTGDFLIAIGQPSLTAVPMQGPTGSDVVVRGAGFASSSLVEVTFAGALVTYDLSNQLGELPAVSFSVPTVAPGLYEVRATDRTGSYGVTTFNVLDVTPLGLSLSTYPTYYLHELVQWTFTVTMNGVPTNVDSVAVNLMTPTGTVPLSAATMPVSTGVYRTPYVFAGSSGDYTLLIEARLGTTHQGDLARALNMSNALPAGVTLVSLGSNDALLHIDSEQRSFQRVPMSFALVQVMGTTASVATSIGAVTAEYSAVGAVVSSMASSTVTIVSSVGTITEAAALINSRAASYSGGLISVNTDLGSIMTSWQSIDASVVEVCGSTARLATSVGGFQTSSSSVGATLELVNGLLADVNTDLNLLTESASLLNATLTNITGTTVTIGSDLGSITEAAALINAHVHQVQGTTATVDSDIGTIVVPAVQVSAAFADIIGTLASVNTSLGTITQAASLLNVLVTLVQNTTATLSSTLNTIQVPADHISAALIGMDGANAIIGSQLNTLNELATLVDAHAIEVNATMTKINSTVGFIWITNLQSGAVLQAIVGVNASINTSYGIVLERAALLNASIFSLNNWTVLISTSIGTVTQNITSIHGQVTAFRGAMATVGSDIGPITVPVARISTQVTALNGNAATISTIFGAMPGTLLDTFGKGANITTSIGVVNLDISKYQQTPTDNTLLIVLVAIVILVVLVALVALRRGRGKRPAVKEASKPKK